jgi:hypothetical protein
MRIYVTHCSSKKDDSLRDSGRKATPDKLYTATPTKRFMFRCKERGVRWAIFSDLYGIWFPDVPREWYEKNPNSVTGDELKMLIENFDLQLKGYSEIWFYYNPGRFHSLYKTLLKETGLKDKVKLFTHIKEIG